MSAPDAVLLEALEQGDVRGAAELLVRAHGAAVLDLCSAMVRDRGRAEDLTQDVFGKAFVALPRFRGEAAVRTWLLRIARNHCIDHLRARRIEPWPDGELDEAQDEEAPLPLELLSNRDDVERALSCLAEGERALVVLRFKNGLEYAELSDAFGLKQGTVRMRISRALAKMRAALEEAPASEAPQAAGTFEELGIARIAAPAAPAAAPPVPPDDFGAAGAPRRTWLSAPADGGAPASAVAASPGEPPLRRAFDALLPALSPALLRRLLSAARALPR